MIEIKFDERLLAQAETILSAIPDGTRKACARAINRSLTAANTQTSKGARAEYLVKADAVKATIQNTKATASFLTGVFKSTGNVIKLGDFRARQGKNALTAAVKRGTGSKKIANAFIATAHSGFRGVLQRENSAAYPLKPLYGPSVPQMIGNEKVHSVVEKRAYEVLNQRLEHEIDALISGYGG